MRGLGNRSIQHLTSIGQKPGRPGRASKWDSSVCERVCDLARQGKFPEEWRAELGVTSQTFRNWAVAHPEFREALEMAHLCLAAYWAAFARTNLTNPKLRSRLLLAMLRKRLPDYWGPRAPSMREMLGIGDREKPLTPKEWAKSFSDEELEARHSAFLLQRSNTGEMVASPQSSHAPDRAHSNGESDQHVRIVPKHGMSDN